MQGFMLFLMLTIQQGFFEKDIEVPIMRFMDVQDCIQAAIIIQDAEYITKGDLMCAPVLFTDYYANLELL